MPLKIKASLMIAAVSAVGLVSAALADSYVEERSFSSSGCPTSSSVTRTTETVTEPIVEERYRTIERPVVIEQTPLIQEKVRMHGHHEKIKVKEYY